MTERWRKKLEGIDQVGPSDDVYERAKVGPTLREAQSPMQRTSTRVATAIAAFLVFALAISLFAIPTLRLHEGSGALTAGGQLLPLWPARTTDEVQALQAQADSGDAAWALDPRQVATRFGQAVLGWPDAWAGGASSFDPTCGVVQGTYPNNASRAIPCAYAAGSNAVVGIPGEGSGTGIASCAPAFLLCGQITGSDASAGPQSAFLSFAIAVCDPSSCHAAPTETVELFQPMGTGGGQIWAVIEASSPSIDLGVSPGQTVREGSSISTVARIRTDDQFGFGVHVGASGSCRLDKATDAYHGPISTDGLTTSAGSELATNFGPVSGTSCQQSEPGYVFAAAGGKPIVRDGVAFDPLQPGGASLYALSAVPITFEWPDEAALSVAPTVTPIAWTTHTDPLGWTIDVPRDWVTKRIDGADARQVYEGAAFGSSTPDQQPGGPTAIGAPPGEVTLLLYHSEGGPPVPPTDDTGPPASLDDLGIIQGGYQLDFSADGIPFSLSIRVGGDGPTPEQLTILQQMVSSIAFVPWRAGEKRNGWTALNTPKANVEWERFGDSRVIVTSVEGTTVMLGPVVCHEGGSVMTSWQPSATCPDSIGLAQWDMNGQPAAGNAPGYHEVLPVHPVIRAWDGTLLSSLDLTA